MNWWVTTIGSTGPRQISSSRLIRNVTSWSAYENYEVTINFIVTVHGGVGIDGFWPQKVLEKNLRKIKLLA